MPSPAFGELADYIRRRMRMSHVYQPIMLRELLARGGRASRTDIARAFLAEDRALLEYYEEITRDMPGRVLALHGIVVREGGEYRLSDDLQGLTDEERIDLIALCEEKLGAFLERRGLAPWQHRRRASGYVPGSLRYDVIRRSGGRCEACGVAAEERALEVDHIVPRNKGGSDDPSNLQALCYKCNAQKRDRDDTDFSALRRSYDLREEGCPFCTVPFTRVVAREELAFAVMDAYPVADLHMLVIPRRHVADWFDLHGAEHNAMLRLLQTMRGTIRERDRSVRGFNVGINCGAAAGQTVFHVHAHLIPRREGDVGNPRGGVRGVIPGKASY
jgi:ATP adenylyltransferase